MQGKLPDGPSATGNVDGKSCSCTKSWTKAPQRHEKLTENDGRSHGHKNVHGRSLGALKVDGRMSLCRTES